MAVGTTLVVSIVTWAPSRSVPVLVTAWPPLAGPLLGLTWEMCGGVARPAITRSVENLKNDEYAAAFRQVLRSTVARFLSLQVLTTWLLVALSR
jgi:hypothetical protein